MGMSHTKRIWYVRMSLLLSAYAANLSDFPRHQGKPHSLMRDQL